MRRYCSYATLLIALNVLTLSIVATGTGFADEKKPEDRKLTFKDDVLPIFRAKCFQCHSGKSPKAKLNLSDPNAILSGGKSGPAIRVSWAQLSLLYSRVAENSMPPTGKKLTAAEKGIIRKWINDGASGAKRGVGIAEEIESDTLLWSFQTPQKAEVPQVKNQHQVRNAIDGFILDRLEDKGLQLSPEASRLVLLRRASFDLIGLPPTPADIDDFLNDKRPDAYERMIDRLLANSHYGERWGRHWLDAAGYADSAGVLFEDRPLPLIYRYRDYVVRALNSGKPYDRFLQEQIAGDELTNYWEAEQTGDRLPQDVIDGITATGFLRTAPDSSRPDFSTIKNAAAQYFYPTLNDTIEIVASATMGITLQCARCHTHKFDPISQTDFYRVQSVFMSGYRPNKWVPQMERRLLIATASQKKHAKQRNDEVNKNVAALNKEIEKLRKEFGDKLFEDSINALPEAERESVRQAFATNKDKRDDAQKKLVEKYSKTLRPADKTSLDKALNEKYPKFKSELTIANQKIGEQNRRKIYFDEIRAFYDLPGEVSTPLLLRGDPLAPGPTVEPGVLHAVSVDEPFELPKQAKDAKTSGRRLAFARWLTQPDHPLVSRTMVNRLWLHHFGKGIVGTPHDLGAAGEEPTHPELLDWLAIEFVESGWSLKHMHRLIMCSATYRQSSNRAASLPVESNKPSPDRVDPDNELLWRQRMRRLEAEPLRDSVLKVSGLLDENLYGYPIPMQRHGSGEVTTVNGQNGNRRSIYLQVLRLTPLTMLQVFDLPEMKTNCDQRMQSTVSTQSLALLNSKALVDAANSFADRIGSKSESEQIDSAVRLAFSRPATDAELDVLGDFLNQQAARRVKDAATAKQELKQEEAERLALVDLCHMLLSANEFLYID